MELNFAADTRNSELLTDSMRRPIQSVSLIDGQFGDLPTDATSWL